MTFVRFLRDALEFFWQGEALATAKAAARPTSNERKALHRARWLLQISNALLEPEMAVFLKDVPREVRAAAALCLLSEAAYLGSISYAGIPSETVQAALRKLHEGDSKLAEAAREAAQKLAEQSQSELAMLEGSQAMDYAVDLRSLLSALVARAGDRQETPAVVVARRIRRIVVTTIAMACMLGALVTWGPTVWYSMRHPLITPSPSWRTSSTADGAPQYGQEQVPYGPHAIFFHTATQNWPWIEFDLDQVQQVGAIEVWNRTDCCIERVAPLVVELSVDDEHWTTVARKQYSFVRWRTTFPATEARYVRLKTVAQNALLHLERVEIRH